jgi:hypothetical protein
VGPHSCASGLELAQKAQESFCSCSNGIVCDAADASASCHPFLHAGHDCLARPHCSHSGESTGFHLRLMIKIIIRAAACLYDGSLSCATSEGVSYPLHSPAGEAATKHGIKPAAHSRENCAWGSKYGADHGHCCPGACQGETVKSLALCW